MLAADLKRKGVVKVAILADSTPYGEAGLTAFAEQARLAGLNLSPPLRFKIGDTAMSSQLQQARASGAQSLVVWGIAEGRQCARAVDEYLMGSSVLPR